ncbi:MAG: cysteine hydrolase [Ruminococcaceae bacterium]|nr:cysteine hydrolase [Oscillospiraceae bacterium]
MELFAGKGGAGRSAHKALDKIANMLAQLPNLRLEQLVEDNAVLIIVDMINGFVNEGPLASPNVLAINDRIAALAAACAASGIPVAALADCHTLSSPEFGSFPPHCLEGTAETELTDQLRAIGGITRIEKNSTNGMLEPRFKDWLREYGSGTYIIVGCCTDLCVQQLALTLKTTFNRANATSRVIVPSSCVATYDLGFHDSGLTGIMALYNMMLGGIELCSEITF